MDQPPSQDSLFVPLSSGDRLHVRRMTNPAAAPDRPPILMLHGAVGNSRIFYTESGKGLGPYLAAILGYPVYAADLRGKGQSEPRISKASTFGQLEHIAEDIPALSDQLRKLHPHQKQIWVAYSWGGVMALAALARLPRLRPHVQALVCFGTKRTVKVWNLERLYKVSFAWNGIARPIANLVGYLPGEKLGFGSDNETRLSLAESVAWIKPGPWVDPRDGFDYSKALQKAKLPSSLFLAGSRDRTLGNPADVRNLIAELGPQRPQPEYRLLVGFDHVNLLVGERARTEVFPIVSDWLCSRTVAQ